MTFFNALMLATAETAGTAPAENVLLLLTGSGANNGTTFTDLSAYGRTITPFGNAKTVTRINDPFGNNVGVMEFDGTNSGLLFANTSAFDFADEDFTIEFWLYNEGSPTDYARIFNPDGDDYFSPIIALNTSNNMATYATTNGTSFDAWSNAGAFDANIGVWEHWALVRSGSKVTIYNSGEGFDVTLFCPTLYHNTAVANLVIGGQQTTPHRTLQGCLSNYRITKGLARYTANFTPPTAAF